MAVSTESSVCISEKRSSDSDAIATRKSSKLCIIIDKMQSRIGEKET